MAPTLQQIKALNVDLTRQVLLYFTRFNIREVRENRIPVLTLERLAFNHHQELGAVVVRVHQPYKPVYVERGYHPEQYGYEAEHRLAEDVVQFLTGTLRLQQRKPSGPYLDSDPFEQVNFFQIQ